MFYVCVFMYYKCIIVRCDWLMDSIDYVFDTIFLDLPSTSDVEWLPSYYS